jgi:hypothetical protein
MNSLGDYFNRTRTTTLTSTCHNIQGKVRRLFCYYNRTRTTTLTSTCHNIQGKVRIRRHTHPGRIHERKTGGGVPKKHLSMLIWHLMRTRKQLRGGGGAESTRKLFVNVKAHHTTRSHKPGLLYTPTTPSWANANNDLAGLTWTLLYSLPCRCPAQQHTHGYLPRPPIPPR